MEGIPYPMRFRRYDRGITNFFELYEQLADTWAAYTSGPDTPLLVSAGGENIPQRVIRPDTWSMFLKRQNEG